MSEVVAFKAVSQDVEVGEVDVVQHNVPSEPLAVAVAVEQDPSRDRKLTFSPNNNDNSPTVLVFSDISVTTKNAAKKVILDDISGSITGGLWAIMGSSGSGKTTLLSTLSLRLDPIFMEIKGHISLNGRDYSKRTLKSMSAYVMQDDLLHAELTVKETLYYAAQLRMSGDVSDEERFKRADFVLDLMGISHAKDTIVGDTRKKGISGGERKRLCVAIELLNHPKLIFLDEPTSGLDSSTALSVCEALKRLSDSGECTVVCTIHQPQPKIFNLFDNLILMKKGHIVYQGGAKKSVNYLASLGLQLPKGESLADFLIQVITPGSDECAVFDQEPKLKPPVDLSFGYEKSRFAEEEGATSWLNQFIVLVRRNWQQYYRRPDLVLMNLLATSLLALFVSLGIWHQIGTAQDSTAKRNPSLFFTCVAQGVLGSLQSINSFPSERAIMLRERSAGAYQVSSYFMAKSFVDTITQLWPPIIFTCIVYYSIGYQPQAYKFFLFMMFMILDSLAATSMAAAVTCICVSVEMSTIVISCLFEMCRLYGGYYFSPTQMDIPRMVHWRFADGLSYIKYAFIGIALNELHGLEIECVPGKGSCPYSTGGQIIEFYSYNDYTIGFCAGILVVFIVGCRVLAYLGLRFIKF